MATALKSLKLGSKVVLEGDLTSEVQRLEGLIGEKAPKIGNVNDETALSTILTSLGATFPVANQEQGGGGE